MPFQLVRTDTDFPCKIPLSEGEHILGRGPLLSCDDKRVSRKHGKLLVTEQSLILESIHENPCFYTTSDEREPTVLKKGSHIQFNHGDKFGLLPNSFWYEIMKIVSDKRIINGDKENNVKELGLNHDNNTDIDCRFNCDETRCDGDQTKLNDDEVRSNNDETRLNGDETRSNLDETRSNCDLNTTNDNIEVNSVVPVNRDISDDLELNKEFNDSNLNDLPPSPSMIHDCPTQISNTQPQSTLTSPSKESPLKRPNEVSPSSGEKRIKLEPQDGDSSAGGSGETDKKDSVQVKAEPSSSTVKNEPNSPVKPKPVQRERCMYGASCYRKNPQHKADFSHPNDSDWGSGPKGQCPYGAHCQKRDPRHWRDHEHPSGTNQPSQQHRGFKVVERHGNIFYINANTVNFYDDHFNVNDSDGDSVDYDYEF